MSTSLCCRFGSGLVLGALCLLSGCQSLDLNLSPLGPRLPQASARNPVVEVLCLWEPAEGTGLDKLPARGFAGQALFITPRQKEPVQVDGNVRIYVFDDQGTIEEQQQPIHQFSFDATSWNAFLRETNLGVAYQFFIPYTRPGVHAAVCSLRVCYESPDGQTIYSKFAKVTLPGKTNPARATGAVLPADERAGTGPTGAAHVHAAKPENVVIPAAYTFEDKNKTDASLRQFQARFDKLLESGAASAAASHAPDAGEESARTRVRLKPAPMADPVPADEE